MHPDCVIQLEKEKCMERMVMDDPSSEPELGKNFKHLSVQYVYLPSNSSD